VIDAFRGAPADSRIALGGPLPLAASSVGLAARARVQVHRFITELRAGDFDSQPDDGDGSTWLLAAAAVEGSTSVRGVSFFAVLSTDAGVVDAAHEFMQGRFGGRHGGCCVRALSTLPSDVLLFFDHATLADGADVPVIVRATVAPLTRTPMVLFAVTLHQWRAVKCRVDARASVDGGGSERRDSWGDDVGDDDDEADDADETAGRESPTAVGSSARRKLLAPAPPASRRQRI
jgi:hypothetical protein